MKKYPSPADVSEMKARGYDSSTIAAAEEESKRWSEAQRICEIIREAFAGVKLGDGVGLAETDAIDDYADDATRAAIRAGDEREDWQRIPTVDLNRHNGLSFFDAEGMRFHLPALLIADLHGDYRQGILFYLTRLDDYSIRKFELLSDVQRRAVREYLLFTYEAPDERFSRRDIQRALERYWIEGV